MLYKIENEDVDMVETRPKGGVRLLKATKRAKMTALKRCELTTLARSGTVLSPPS